MRPVVSIIMPMHRPSSQLAGLCIASLNEVTSRGLELVLCLNGRPRNHFDMILNQINREVCTKVIVLHQEECLTPGEARSRCLSQCSGEWVLFLDSDDVIGKNLIRNKLSSGVTADIIFGNALERRWEGDSYASRPFYRDYSLLLRSRKIVKWLVCFGINPFPNSGTLIRRETLQKCAYPLCRHEDFALYLELIIKEGATFYCDRSFDIMYSIQKDSVSGDKFRSRCWHMNVLASFYKLDFLRSAAVLLLGLVGLLVVRLIWLAENLVRQV